MEGLEIEHAQIADGWVSLSIKGEIDLSTVEQLEGAMDQVFGDDNANVLVDLTPTSFMDSTGLRSLINSHNRFRESARSFAVMVQDGQISRLLDISGVRHKLQVISDPGEILPSES